MLKTRGAPVHPPPAFLAFNPAEAAHATALWDAALVATPPSFPVSSRSPLSPPRSSLVPNGHGGSCASSLTSKLLGAEKRFLFIVGSGGEDNEFPEVGLVGKKIAAMEVEVKVGRKAL